MTRVLSYNICLGGTKQVKQLGKMIQAADPDVVGLVEATDAQVVQELAKKLGMQFRITGEGQSKRDWQIAILSRLPILNSTIHARPNVLTRRHLLEVQVEETDGQALSLFAIHLTARVYNGTRSNLVRRAEVRELLDIMAQSTAVTGNPHLAMGDFNSLAPGDSLEASTLVRNVVDLYATKKKAQRTLGRRVLTSTARGFVHSWVGGKVIDAVGPNYAQGGIDLLLKAGYVDCFRQLHPTERGYTFPAMTPATRIDYIFASPELAQNLTSCNVITKTDGVRGEDASDHLPIWAEFAQSHEK